MGTLICPRCRRVTVFDPMVPPTAPRKYDTHLCMDCIFDDEEHIVRGDK